MNRKKTAYKLLKLANELIAFNKGGYGAWIDDEGKFLKVRDRGHSEVAEKELKQRGLAKKKSNYISQAMDNGWVRVIWNNDNLNINYKKKKISMGSLRRVLELLKEYDWGNIIVEVTDMSDFLATYDDSEAMKFVRRNS